MGEVSDALGPDELVQFGVDSHVFGFHHFVDQLFDLFHSGGGFVFEGGSVCQLVDVDGGIDSGFGQAGSLFFFAHNLRINYID